MWFSKILIFWDATFVDCKCITSTNISIGVRSQSIIPGQSVHSHTDQTWSYRLDEAHIASSTRTSSAMCPEPWNPLKRDRLLSTAWRSHIFHPSWSCCPALTCVLDPTPCSSLAWSTMLLTVISKDTSWHLNLCLYKKLSKNNSLHLGNVKCHSAQSNSLTSVCTV